MQIATFSGLTCGACVKLLTKRLNKLPGLTSAIGDQAGIFELQAQQTYSTEQINKLLTGTEYTLKTLK